MIGEALLHHLTTFGTLGPDEAAAVLAIDGEVRSYGRDCDIIRSGDRPTYSVLALDGLLIRYSPRADGGRQVYGMYFPTDAPCLETLHTDIMDHNLTPAVETRVALIPHAVLYETMDRFPRVLSLIWRQTLVQASMFRAWLMRNSSQPAHAAMAHLFCECLRRTQAAGLARGNVCDLPVTQEVLADALGISLVHVNRTLQILRQTGAVSFRSGVLEVHDPAQLAGIADFDPHYLHLHR